jgi:hypothetical protein
MGQLVIQNLWLNDQHKSCRYQIPPNECVSAKAVARDMEQPRERHMAAREKKSAILNLILAVMCRASACIRCV